MQKYLFLIICLTLSHPVFAQTQQQNLNELDSLILRKDIFVEQKQELIFNLKNELKTINTRQNTNEALDIYKKLYQEYKSFVYDSAFKYIRKVDDLATQLNLKKEVNEAKIETGFILLSSGLFKEALDILKSIQVDKLSQANQKDFYTVIARTYYDLADYDNDDYFSSKYCIIGNHYLDSALSLMNEDDSNYWAAMGLRRMKAHDLEGAADAFNFLLSQYEITPQEYAIATSSLGYIYTLLDRKKEAIDLLIKAAKADLKASTKETVALRNLAVHLFDEGDIQRAYHYIKLALDDATYFNARHRKVEIGSILPIIEGERLTTVEKQKLKIERYAFIVTTLALLVIFFFLIIYLQLRRLKKIRGILQQTNENLKLINHELMEANAIKEEYIGYFFNANSEYIQKMETLQKNIHRKIASRQFDDLSAILRNNNLKKERENLFYNFDKIFLKLFPEFVSEFNQFFSSEDQIILKNDELLSPEMRIFALIRLGISDNEKIARFLNYSVNTIYTYKTKVKNKIMGDRESFNQKIMGKKPSNSLQIHQNE